MFFLTVSILTLVAVLTPDLSIAKDIICTQTKLPLIDPLLNCDKMRSDQEKQMSIKPCIFCHLDKEHEEIIHQDDEFLVFKDINPAGKTHWLVIPRNHTPNVKSLGKDDLGMIIRMNNLAKNLTEIHGMNKTIRGFHVPPFISVNHLHLHIIEKPFKNFWRSLKYPTCRWNGWFETVERTIERLNK